MITENPPTIIKAANVSKTFRLPIDKNNSIKGAVVNFWRRKKGYQTFQALRDVSFEIQKGEFFGIVGRNGSGKSTLLKLLAGIYVPSSGSISVQGKLTPFIELGVGFNPELTGRENVFLNGALLGFNRSQMEEMYKDIVDFAELHRFMGQKLKNYSSGMQVRLAFSIAIRVKTDILLIDEVLAVGDTAFQQKCFDYFESLKKGTTTVVFVSHDMDSVKRFCDRALVIQNGSLKFIGKPQGAADRYVEENEEQIIQDLRRDNKKPIESKGLTINTLNDKGKPMETFSCGQKAYIQLKWNPKKINIKPRHAGITIFNEGRIVYGSNTGKNKPIKPGTSSITYEVELNLGPGKYTLVAGLFKSDNLEHADLYQPHGPDFYITNIASSEKSWSGLTKLESEWIYEK